MPATIDANGLTVPTSAEILAGYLNGIIALDGSAIPGMLSIYGAGINVDPNSPDGQMLNLLTLSVQDQYQFLAQIYSSFDPDQAIGTQLDNRCAINGVVRQAGTNTLVTVLVTVTQAVTLNGLDTTPLAPFTVSDTAGSQFVLQATHVFSGSGSASLVFQAKLTGPVSALANTLTTIVTVTLGVASVNNPAGASYTGIAEETDAALRIRRARSVALPSQGFLDGLLGALLDVTNVTAAVVLENKSNTNPDGNGIPAHSIWCIVNGGTNANIAQVIYVKRNAGCGMKGSVSVGITQLDGNTCTILFDRPTAQLLYVGFSIAALAGQPAPDKNYIKAQLAANFTYGIGQQADISSIIAFVQNLVPGAYITVVNATQGVSPDNATWTAILNPTGVNYQFYLTTGSITIP